MRQINQNINCKTQITSFMLPRLLKRPRSAVIDISTTVDTTNGNTFFPLLSAVKAYNTSLNQSIQKAYSDKIDVMVVEGYLLKNEEGSGPLFSVNNKAHTCQTINHLGRYN